MVGSRADNIPKRLWAGLLLFVGTLIGVTVLIPGVVFLTDIVNLSNSSVGVWVTVMLVGGFIGLTLTSGIYPLILTLYSVVYINRQLKRLDWESLLKLTPISTRERLYALLFASNYSLLPVTAPMAALPLSASIIRVILSGDSYLSLPNPVPIIIVHALLFCVMWTGVLLAAMLLAVTTAVSFEEVWLVPVVGGISIGLLTLLAPIAMFVSPVWLAPLWVFVPYGVALVCYWLALRAL